jgi:hypothetical protein
MASAAKSVIALLHAPTKKYLGQSPHSLVNLVRRNGLPLIELVLPEHGARVGCRGYAAKQIIEGGYGIVIFHLFEIGNA